MIKMSLKHKMNLNLKPVSSQQARDVDFKWIKMVKDLKIEITNANGDRHKDRVGMDRQT